ncbi:MAG: hypothetical protein CYG60_04220 [Actinobacteria bacterium]|nr:MAG: hypothetical protein CYG60_04220 [Actinomycetota bacterium]
MGTSSPAYRGFRSGRDPRTRRKVWYGIRLLADDGPDDGGGDGPGETPPEGHSPKRSKQSETVETVYPHEVHKTAGEPNNCFAPPSTVSRGAGDDVAPEIAAFLADPPTWFLDQAEKCAREGNPERLVNPLATVAADELYGDRWRWREVLPAVEAWLRENRGAGGGDVDTRGTGSVGDHRVDPRGASRQASLCSSQRFCNR